MRFLKRQTLNRRVPNDNRLYVDIDSAVIMETNQYLMLPSGDDTSRPVGSNGMIRYNTTSNELEVYQSSKWRALKYKEASPIVQQSLGAGDSMTVYFGPLNAAYDPTDIASNVPVSGGQSAGQFGGQNIFVIVENVIQLYNTNYIVEQNPTIGGEVYTPYTSASVSTGATTLYFNTSLTVTGSSGTGTEATLTFTTQPEAPFSIGETITVTGMTPTAYNGSWTVTASTSSSVSFSSSATGSMVFPGTVTAEHTVYPATDIIGAEVTGSASLQSNTVIVSYTTDPVTDALTSITIDKPTVTSTIPAGTALTITETSQVGTGYYLKFSSPVPYGKIVTALIGFDQ